MRALVCECRLANSNLGGRELLKSVCIHKSVFYKCWCQLLALQVSNLAIRSRTLPSFSLSPKDSRRFRHGPYVDSYQITAPQKCVLHLAADASEGNYHLPSGSGYASHLSSTVSEPISIRISWILGRACNTRHLTEMWCPGRPYNCASGWFIANTALTWLTGCLQILLRIARHCLANSLHSCYSLSPEVGRP